MSHSVRVCMSICMTYCNLSELLMFSCIGSHRTQKPKSLSREGQVEVHTHHATILNTLSRDQVGGVKLIFWPILPTPIQVMVKHPVIQCINDNNCDLVACLQITHWWIKPLTVNIIKHCADVTFVTYCLAMLTWTPRARLSHLYVTCLQANIHWSVTIKTSY